MRCLSRELSENVFPIIPSDLNTTLIQLRFGLKVIGRRGRGMWACDYFSNKKKGYVLEIIEDVLRLITPKVTRFCVHWPFNFVNICMLTVD